MNSMIVQQKIIVLSLLFLSCTLLAKQQISFHNGDSLKGEILSLKNNSLEWSHPLATETLYFQKRKLSRWENTQVKNSSSSLQIFINQEESLYADITPSTEPQTLNLSAPHCGNIKVPLKNFYGFLNSQQLSNKMIASIEQTKAWNAENGITIKKELVSALRSKAAIKLKIPFKGSFYIEFKVPNNNGYSVKHQIRAFKSRRNLISFENQIYQNGYIQSRIDTPNGSSSRGSHSRSHHFSESAGETVRYFFSVKSKHAQGSMHIPGYSPVKNHNEKVPNNAKNLNYISLSLEAGTSIQNLRIIRWNGLPFIEEKTEQRTGPKGFVKLSETEGIFAQLSSITPLGNAQITTKYGNLSVPIKNIRSFNNPDAQNTLNKKTDAIIWFNKESQLKVNEIQITNHRLTCVHPQLGSLSLDLNYIYRIDFGKHIK